MNRMYIIKKFLKEFFHITKSEVYDFEIEESKSYMINLIENKMWERGEEVELEQFYKINNIGINNFWSSNGEYSHTRKLHSGLPKLIVKTLTDIAINDLNTIESTNMTYQEIWKDIEDDNDFYNLLKDAVKDALVSGDGAFKIYFSNDNKLRIEFVDAEFCKYIYENGIYKETIFKKQYDIDGYKYTLLETYGNGYIKYNLYDEFGKEVKVKDISLKNIVFMDGEEINTELNLAIPLKFWKSELYKTRGKSIFDGKKGSLDALDEVISEWMEALRKGRVDKFIPKELIPKDLDGNLMRSSDFANDFIKLSSPSVMEEGTFPQPTVIQPNIQVEAYLQTYISFLDLCLQGIISPSTLGIDTKKLDNADAQREKEKTTLYTRQNIIDTLVDVIKKIVKTSLMAYLTQQGQIYDETNGINVVFGEYANPSFEAQIETLAKAAPGKQIISFERIVEELYGDNMSEEEKEKEVERLIKLNGTSEFDLFSEPMIEA